MAKNGKRPPEIKPEKADDFKLINGIKQGIENRLHSAGILTYAQLASLNPDEILEKLGKVIGYTRKRIADEDWSGQARQLALHQPSREEGTVRQHYATFTIELLLGEENDVRRTRMVHVQSEAEETWAGWDETRLLRFITRSAQVHIEETKLGVQEPAAPPNIEATQVEEAAPPPVTGSPKLREIAIVSPATGAIHRIVPEGQSFGISVTVDLADVQMVREENLDFRAQAYAKALGRGSRKMIGTTQGTFVPGSSATIELNSDGLSEGAYRIGVDLEMSAPSSVSSQADLAALLDCGFLKVY